MMKQFSYNLFHSRTISNNVVHYFFILLEYLWLIFPAIFNASIKLTRFNQSKLDFLSQTFNCDKFITVKYINENPIASLTFICVGSIFIFLYYLAAFFGMPNCSWLKIPQMIFINFIDIAIFRYFSILFIDAYFWRFIDKFYLQTSFAESIVSVLFLMLTLLFICTTYFHISNLAVLINISNPLLVPQERKYPYDQLSKEFEIILLILKVCISIENCYFVKTMKIDLVSITFNALIVFINIALFIRFSLFNFCINYKISNLFGNANLNKLRNAISIYNFIMTISFLIVMTKSNTLTVYVFLLIVGINATIIICYIEECIVRSESLINQPISYELLLLMLINNDKSQSFRDQLTKIQYHSFLKHKGQCRENNCKLCINFSSDLKANIKYFYKYLKKIKATSPYERTVILLYFKMIKKPFKFFRYYNWLIQQYKLSDITYIRNITMIVETWLLTENDEYCGIIEDLLYITKLESKMRKLIDNLLEFIPQNLKIKRPETVMNLSNDLSSLMQKIKLFVIQTNKNKGSFASMDSTLKHIDNVLTYNIIIIRFALECLINQPLQGLPLLNMDSQDDFLRTHYSFAHTLICSINLKSTAANKEFKLLKVTGDLKRKKSYEFTTLSEYFSKEIIKDGYRLLYHQINKCNSANSEYKTFFFPFVIRGTIEYMRYSFRIMKTLKLNSIIIYGQYLKENKPCLLLDRQENNKIEIISFCHDALKLIFFKRKWIPYLKQINFRFYLSSIFKSVKIYDSQNLIECVLDYRYYLKKAYQLNNELKSLDSFKRKESNEKHLVFSIEEMKKYSSSSIKLSLEKITDYSSGKGLYQMISKTKFGNTETRPENEKNYNLDNQGEEMIINYHSTTVASSNSASRAHSGNPTHSVNSKKDSEFNILDLSLKQQTVKETKNLGLFSWIMIILNCVLILTCTIFLITQVSQTQQLSKLAEVKFQYKSLWLYFLNFYISFTFTICFSPIPEQTVECINQYTKYWDYAREFYGFTVNYSLFDYTNLELRAKTDKAQESLVYFKKFIYSYSNKELQIVLTRSMNYYEFEQSESDPKLIILNITFEEGIRKYINTIFRLTSPEIDYESIPIYFVSYSNETFSLNNLPKGQILIVQREIYKALLNYINYYNAFAFGDTDLALEVTNLGENNKIMNMIFMIAVACLNLILAILCYQNIQIAYKLFTILILNVVFKLEDQTISQILFKKMEILSKLVKLYDKNPNDLVNKLTLQKDYGLLQSKNNEKTKYKEDKQDELQLHATFDRRFYYSLVGMQLLVLVILFGFFFIVIIILDIILTVNYTNVFNVFDYVFLHFTLENNIMIDLSFISVERVGNLTGENISNFLQIQNPDDGVLNQLIRESFVQFQTITDFMIKNPKKYPSFDNDVPYSCDKIFYSFNDTFITIMITEYGYDLRGIATNICMKHQLLNSPYFSYLRTDILNRILLLTNRNTFRDYSSIYKFMTSNAFYEVIVITMFVFRPLSSFFRNKVLSPGLNSTFSFYVMLVGLYLCINIILEVCLVIIVKLLITSKLTKIQKNLHLMNNCLN